MRLAYVLAVLALPICAAGATQGPGRCDIPQWFDHHTRHVGVRRVRQGAGALFYTAPLSVNTDGAPTSYHPDDPWGTRGLAINTICNGANAVLPSGRKIGYDRCTDLIAAYRVAKAAGWTDPKAPRIDWYGVAARGWKPCYNELGYFVSQTAQAADPDQDRCAQSRYLNALELPFSKVPNAASFRQRGADRQDVAVVYNPESGQTDYTIIGDVGSARSLGEVSVAAAKRLRSSELTPKTKKEVYKLSIDKAHVLILTGERIAPPYTADKIRKGGEAAFARWGGVRRGLRLASQSTTEPLSTA